jgi:hypothetical protein
MPSIFGTKEEILAQIEGFKMMNAWKEANPGRLSAVEPFPTAEELYAMMSPEARDRYDDPTRQLAGRTRAALSPLP